MNLKCKLNIEFNLLIVYNTIFNIEFWYIMDIKSINNFSSALQNLVLIPNSKNYISEVSGTYELVSSKGSKTLNSDKIATLAVSVFNEIDQMKGISFQTQLNLFNNLRQGLERYTDRLYQSKTWYQKIGHFFGCASNEERRINHIISAIDLKTNANSPLGSTAQLVNKTVQDFKYTISRQETQPISKLKHFFLGVLDSTSHDFPGLNGMTHSEALYWYISHMQSFLALPETSSKFTKEEIGQMNDLIKQFKFAEKLAALLSASQSDCWDEMVKAAQKNPQINMKALHIIARNNVERNPLRKGMLDLIRDAVNNLKPGERVILPGGYMVADKEKIVKGVLDGSGHAVLYSIFKVSEGKYRFQIVNTGEGADLNAPVTDTLKNLFEGLKSLVTNKSNYRWTVKDIEYDNLTREDLSDDFFNQLINKKMPNQATTMEDIHVLIGQRFGKEKLSSKGREHKAQKHGSCTHKSLTATAKAFLPGKLYHAFKVWMTKTENKNFQSALNNGEFYGMLSQQTADLFMKESCEILDKRIKKGVT